MWNFVSIFGNRKLESLNYRMVLLTYYRDPTFNRFGTVPACDGRTDRRNDGHTHDDSIYRA